MIVDPGARPPTDVRRSYAAGDVDDDGHVVWRRRVAGGVLVLRTCRRYGRWVTAIAAVEPAGAAGRLGKIAPERSPIGEFSFVGPARGTAKTCGAAR